MNPHAFRRDMRLANLIVEDELRHDTSSEIERRMGQLAAVIDRLQDPADPDDWVTLVEAAARLCRIDDALSDLYPIEIMRNELERQQALAAVRAWADQQRRPTPTSRRRRPRRPNRRR
jgi:hypothetical protein